MSPKRLLAIELVKFKAPVNYISLGIYLFLMLVVAIFTIGNSATFSVGGEDTGATSGNVLSLQMSFMRLLMAIIIILNIGKEFATGTVKKNIIDGYRRSDWLTGKVLASFVIYISIFVFGLLIYFTTGSMVEGIDEAYKNYPLESILRDFIVYFYYTGLILAIALITRSIALSFIIYLFIGLVEFIINLGLNKILSTELDYRSYLPSGSVQHLQTVPLDNVWNLLLPACYFVLFLSIPYFLFTRKDLK